VVFIKRQKFTMIRSTI